MTSRKRGRETIVPLGDVNDYGDDDAYRSKQSRPKKSKAKRYRVRDVPGPTVTYSLVWSKPLMNAARYAAGIFSVVALAVVIWMIFFWLIGVLPAFPTRLASYAVVFFFFMLPVYIVGASVVWWMAVEFYALSCVLQVMALGLSSYLFGALWYQWIVCIDGSAAPDCVNSYFTDTMVLILLGVLWISGVIATGAHLVVIFRGSPATSVTQAYGPAS